MTKYIFEIKKTKVKVTENQNAKIVYRF